MSDMEETEIRVLRLEHRRGAGAPLLFWVKGGLGGFAGSAGATASAAAAFLCGGLALAGASAAHLGVLWRVGTEGCPDATAAAGYYLLDLSAGISFFVD